MSKRLLRLHRIVPDKIRVGRSSFYSGVQPRLWPKPVKISARCSAWPEDELDEIIRARAAGARDNEIRQLVDRLERERDKHPVHSHHRTALEHPSRGSAEGKTRCVR